MRTSVPEKSKVEHRAEQIQKSQETFARLTAQSAKPPKYKGAFVERVLRRTTRRDDRSFRVRLPRGHAIVEKTTELVSEGGAPEFAVRIAVDWHDPPPDAAEREAEAVAIVLRHIKRHGDEPYKARERFRLHDAGAKPTGIR